jgi:hypothetical protein
MHTMLSRRPDGSGDLTADGITWIINPARAPQTRTVRFPKNRALGELFAETYPAVGRSLSQMKKLGRARGEVDVPAGHRLILYVEGDINEGGLKALATLAPQDLQSLRLGGCGLTDKSLIHLRNLTWLEHLDLSCNPVSGEALAHLEGMLLLERLELWGCDLTEEGLANLPPLPSLRHLSVAIHLDLPDDALASLVSLPVLESLDLRSTPIGDRALAHLRKLRQLRSLHISHTKLTCNGIAELRAALPLCQISWF